MSNHWYHVNCPKFMTSIPKSGTYLLRTILRMEWPVSEGKTRRLDGEVGIYGWRKEAFQISPGGYHARGHVMYSTQAEILTDGRVTFFLFRDPRDIMLSWRRVLPTINDNSSLARFGDLNLKYSKDPLADMIRRLPHYFMGFAGWLNLEDVIPIRYEGLINNPYEELERTSIEIPEPLEYLVERSKLRGGPTYMQGKTNIWHDEAESHHKAAFEASEGWSSVMERYGYD